MAQRPLTLNIANFVSSTTGKPIALGTIYIGEKDLDPTVLGNRKTVVVVEEDGTETQILPAAQPLTLSAGGVIQYNGGSVVVLVDGVYSIKVLDALSAQQYYVPRANAFLEEVTDTGLLILNGSFENTTADATKPDDWTITETATGTIAINTAQTNHGNKALEFTSVDSSGAGQAVTTQRFPVTPDKFVNVDFDLRASAVDSRNTVSIVWYNLAGSPISTTDLLDATTNSPLTWATYSLTGKAPATAYSAELVLKGMNTGGTTMIGSSGFDNVKAAVSSTYHASFDVNAVAAPWLFTGVPSGTKTIQVAAHRFNPTVLASINITLGDKNGLATGSQFRTTRTTMSTTPGIGTAITAATNFVMASNNNNAGQVLEGLWTITAADYSQFKWQASGFTHKGATTGTVFEFHTGSGTLSDFLTQIQINSSAVPAAGGRVSVTCHV